MNRSLACEVGVLVFAFSAAFAADNAPTSGAECPVPKGCTSNTIDADCAIMACKAKGCNSDYSSGACKDLKELHEISCFGAKKDCGRDLPRLRGDSSQTAPQGPAIDPSSGTSRRPGADQGAAAPASGNNKFKNAPRLGSSGAIPRPSTAQFECSRASCSCSGDADCNDMFSSGVCGRDALCDQTGGVTCTCLRASRR